jgi:two-component system cell cycle sensor histidine kinase/response regulator CckA
VFFPATSQLAQALEEKTDVSEEPVIGGTETILIVEDEPILREMARSILEECGYRLLEAKTGREALEAWEKSDEKIDLLLTDIVMPEGVSGVDLAERLIARQPKLKVIFTSGYSVNEVSQKLLGRYNAHFLQKPYTRNVLAKAVRDCLDENVTTSSVATA